jgi:hypothetical protein
MDRTYMTMESFAVHYVQKLTALLQSLGGSYRYSSSLQPLVCYVTERERESMREGGLRHGKGLCHSAVAVKFYLLLFYLTPVSVALDSVE